MEPFVAIHAQQVDPATAAPVSEVLDRVDVPVRDSHVTLTSGRRYEVAADPDGDRLTIRGRAGNVLLHVVVTDRGPVLSFESADIEIAGVRRLALSADDVSIEARRSMAVRVEGDCTHAIEGARHTTIRGQDRLEAQSVQVQANESGIELRAAGRIGLDGEHIGLNDDPCPQPFGWSAIASGPERGD